MVSRCFSAFCGTVLFSKLSGNCRNIISCSKENLTHLVKSQPILYMTYRTNPFVIDEPKDVLFFIEVSMFLQWYTV